MKWMERPLTEAGNHSISWPMPNGLTPCRWDIRRPPNEQRQRRKLFGNVRRVLFRNSTCGCHFDRYLPVIYWVLPKPQCKVVGEAEREARRLAD
jgi:hypothetical protein